MNKEYVYFSKIRMILFGMLILAFSILACAAGLKTIKTQMNQAILFFSFGLGMLVVFYLKIFKNIKYLSEPYITFSNEGIEFTNKDNFKWNEIVENDWHERNSGFIRGAVSIFIKNDKGLARKINASFLELTGEQYIQKCQLYSQKIA
jgi:hypothetical protein